MFEKEAKELCEKTLRMAEAEHCEIVLSGENEASTRFANNAITQNVAKTNTSLLVKAAFGSRVGSVRTNAFDDDSLRSAARRAEEIARLSEPDSEYLPPVGPRTFADTNAYDEAIANAAPEDRAAVVRAGIAKVEAAGLNSAGSYATNSGFTAVANSAGFWGYHPWSHARYLCTVMSDDSSGWAESAANHAAKLDAPGAAERSIAKSLAGRNPQTVEAKPYTVILEPEAAAGMLTFLAWTLDAKAAHEGRSAFTDKEGLRIAAPNITLSSRPDHPECPSAPFSSDGLPVPNVTWIADGVLKTLAYSRFWAQKTGHEYTGTPPNLLLAGGDSSLDDLIASVEEGLLVTRFWYIRFVDPMRLLLTGMTRDGLFLIREGKVAGGVKNMRFNESPLNMLRNVMALGEPENCGGRCFCPPLKVAEYRFTSGTTF